MKTERLNADHIRAALRTQEARIRELLDAIELRDAGTDAVVSQIELVEDSLRRLRLAA
jgi:hypothetical protein